jgi:transcription elongation factor Elf1
MIIVWTIVAALVFIFGFIVGVHTARNAYEKKQLLNMMDDTLKIINDTVGKTKKKEKKSNISTYKDVDTKEPYHIDWECLRCNRVVEKEAYAIVDKRDGIHKILCQQCIGKETFMCTYLVQVRNGGN